MKTVSDYMTKTIHTIGEDISAKKAQEMMHEYQCRHLPVLHAGKVIGVLSDRDLKMVIEHLDSETLPVSELMSEEPYTVSPEATLKEVAQVMRDKKLGSAIVVGSDNKPVGIFTVSNALEALVEAIS